MPPRGGAPLSRRALRHLRRRAVRARRRRPDRLPATARSGHHLSPTTTPKENHHGSLPCHRTHRRHHRRLRRPRFSPGRSLTRPRRQPGAAGSQPGRHHRCGPTTCGDTVAKGFRADVRDLTSLQAAMTDAAEHFGRIDIVIANAGIDTMAPMASIDPRRSSGSSTSTSPECGAPSAPRCPTCKPTRDTCWLCPRWPRSRTPRYRRPTPQARPVSGPCATASASRCATLASVSGAPPTFFRTPMMDDVIADPAGRELWGGNKRPLEDGPDADRRRRDRRWYRTPR